MHNIIILPQDINELINKILNITGKTNIKSQIAIPPSRIWKTD